MTRLSSLDASFLRVETPTAHMHVGWLAHLDLPPGADRFDTTGLTERIASRLHLVPRFRQRVTAVPLGVGEPVWRDDPRFEIGVHVTEYDRAAPLERRSVHAVADEFFSTPLDRDRPLWRIVVLPRLRGGRAAVLGKVHHAMVDGIAAVELGVLLFDLERDAVPAAPVDWDPEPGSAGLRLTVDSVADGALEQFRRVRRAARLGRSPGQAVRVADSMARAAFSLVEDAINPAPASYLNVPIGPRRTLATHSVRLRRLHTVKERLGISLNDVALAACAGALRRFALARGERPHDLRVMVPVNVRGDGDGAGGNRITFAFVDLPVGSNAARERVMRVARAMGDLKESGRIAGSARLLDGLGVLPEPLKERAARMAVSPRLYNLTISNVPGPRMTLFAAGAEVRSIYPVIPIPDRHALAIGVVTYADHANFAFYADPGALPRSGRLPALLEDAVAELELLDGSAGASARVRRGGHLTVIR